MKWNQQLSDYLLQREMKNLVNVVLGNYKLLPMAKSDLTLFGTPARYNDEDKVQDLSCLIFKEVWFALEKQYVILL